MVEVGCSFDLIPGRSFPLNVSLSIWVCRPLGRNCVLMVILISLCLSDYSVLIVKSGLRPLQFKFCSMRELFMGEVHTKVLP